MADIEINTSLLIKRFSDELGEAHSQRIIQQCRAEQAEARLAAAERELEQLKKEATHVNGDHA
jgi:AraC-like DNA-binding protein